MGPSKKLMKQQTAGDKVPGWHKIEEASEEEKSYGSSDLEASPEDYFKTQDSRLTSQPAPVDSQYIDFLDQIGKNQRFSITELKEIESHFKKGAKKIKVNVEGEDGKIKETTELVMYIEQFREQMGLLGQR